VFGVVGHVVEQPADAERFSALSSGISLTGSVPCVAAQRAPAHRMHASSQQRSSTPIGQRTTPPPAVTGTPCHGSIALACDFYSHPNASQWWHGRFVAARALFRCGLPRCELRE
jgi:hypothetical protein